MFRCVFDTNTVVSATLFRGSIPEQALFLALSINTVLMSQELADELNDVLSRAGFDRYTDRENREEFLQDLVRQAESVEITVPVRACRDPNDDKILELATNGDADYIVTGDDDLLVMNPFRNIAIITPAEFLAIASAGDQ
jgi:putative PIN family toxin of toxin-antitoxin system